jgi:SWIM zinc finger.
MAVESSSRKGVWHYVSVGPYGAKCTCEANMIKGLICRHIIIALITWNMVSLIKTGEGVDVGSLGWLKNKPLRARPSSAATGSTAARADGRVDLRHGRRWADPRRQ